MTQQALFDFDHYEPGKHYGTRDLGLRDPAREHAHAAPAPGFQLPEVAFVPSRRHAHPPCS
jgi:hypothetical protein